MADRVVLHIGVHKTGTTATQAWADKNRGELRDRFGLDVYSGRLGGKNHIEFPLLCMRSDRNLYARVMYPDSCLPSWKAETRAHIAEQLATPAPAMLISAEGLCYLREADELATLRELLGPREVDVVVMLRDRAAFLASYRSQMKALGFRPSVYPESFNYVEADTWVIRFDEMLAAYGAAFGEERISVLSYEDELERYGSTVPSIAVAAGLPLDELPEWEGVWLNRTRAPETVGTRTSRVLRHPGATISRRLRRLRTSSSG
jgi:hypothetical protein